MGFNTTCNATLEDLRIVSEVPIAGSLNFHQLGLIICAASTLIAVLLSFYLMWMHALHYTRPYEQRHIIRILFMIPIYAVASLLSFMYYWHAIYFEVISDCYEAFAIASFFALLCHYIAPNLHDQKSYFRNLTNIKPWVWPVSWMMCCGGRTRGPFRTPRSGLTWFNVIWTGIYQYCFIRIAMTITAVVTQYFGKYCESSDSPVFAHIWVLVIEGVAVTIAMFMVIQFYIQMRHDLSEHRPFLKVLAIKLVIFLSFWQSFVISALTGPTFNIIQATDELAYPDISVGIPSLLVCVEMACFAVLHIFAYPYSPYRLNASPTKYPVTADSASYNPNFGCHEANQGGFLGIKAFVDAMNPWDLVKAFARGMRWIFIGVKHREADMSYTRSSTTDVVLDSTVSGGVGYKGASADDLPIAQQFRHSRSTEPPTPIGSGAVEEEGAGLIAHAQPSPATYGRNIRGYESPEQLASGQTTPRAGMPYVHSPNSAGNYTPARLRFDPVTGQEISSGGRQYDSTTGLKSEDGYLHVNSRDDGYTYSAENSPIASPGDIGMARTTYLESREASPAGNKHHGVAPQEVRYGRDTNLREAYARSARVEDRHMQRHREPQQQRLPGEQQWQTSSPIPPAEPRRGGVAQQYRLPYPEGV